MPPRACRTVRTDGSSVIITCSFTAAITITLNVGELSDRIKGPKDLAHARVLTLEDSTSEQYLTNHRQRHQTLADLSSALQQLAEGKADAVVYDAPILRYMVLQGFGDRVRVLPGSEGVARRLVSRPSSTCSSDSCCCVRSGIAISASACACVDSIRL